MSKFFNIGFWAVMAAVLLFFGYEGVKGLRDTSDEPRVRIDTSNLEDDSPRCVNARSDVVDIQPRQHKVFVERKFAGMIVQQDEKTVIYDYDELKKEPPEYRDFVLRAACARTANQDAQAAECVAMKRLRDENRITREKIELIAQRLAAASPPGNSAARTQTLTACFDTPG